MNDELRFGYTADDLDRFARVAAGRAVKRGINQNRTYLRDLAIGAIGEHLYSAAEKPTELDLIYAGTSAVCGEVKATARAYGQDSDDTNSTAPRFETYWFDVTQETAQQRFDESIVDAIAVHEALDQISPTQRKIVTLLAEHGTAKKVAEFLGVNSSYVYVQLRDARLALNQVWLDWETPLAPPDPSVMCRQRHPIAQFGHTKSDGSRGCYRCESRNQTRYHYRDKTITVKGIAA